MKTAILIYMDSSPNVLSIAFSLIIDYFRWTQLFPMMAAWTISVGMLLIIVFDRNQLTVNQDLSSFESWIEARPAVRSAVVSVFEYVFSEEEADKSFFEAFRSVVFKIWGIASLVLLALAWLAGLIFGPFAPCKLKRKLGVALLASLALTFAYVLCYFALPDQFNGPTPKNIIAFSLIGITVFLVSTWSLVISQLLGTVAHGIAKPTPSEPEMEQEKRMSSNR